jgi:hypothetical protein
MAGDNGRLLNAPDEVLGATGEEGDLSVMCNYPSHQLGVSRNFWFLYLLSVWALCAYLFGQRILLKSNLAITR